MLTIDYLLTRPDGSTVLETVDFTDTEREVIGLMTMHGATNAMPLSSSLSTINFPTVRPSLFRIEAIPTSATDHDKKPISRLTAAYLAAYAIAFAIAVFCI